MKSLIGHEKYDSNTIDYDVSLLELAEPIELNENSAAAPVATSEPRGGTETVVSGWGTLSVSCNLSGIFAALLHKNMILKNYIIDFSQAETHPINFSLSE